MNELLTIKEHLRFLIDLELKVKAKYFLEDNEEMRSHASATLSAFREIYDYVVELEVKLEKEVINYED